ncbi:MAG: cupin domain-containing protein [Bacteroidota bacterium]
MKTSPNHLKRTTDNSEHYLWGNNCQGWHLLKSEDLSVIREMMPPGTSETPHFHQRAQQLFYILQGTATFEVNGQQITVNGSESIHIPAGTTHCIHNKALTDLHFLVISQPKSHGDRVVREGEG